MRPRPIAYRACVATTLAAFVGGAHAQQFPLRELRRPIPPAPASSMSPIYVAGDFDGNGTLDVVALRRSGQRPFLPMLLANDGHGAFREVTGSFAAALQYPTAGAAGDLDRDGDLDLLVVGQGGNWLFRNDGTGRFTELSATHLPERHEYAQSVALGDLDGDGDLDAVLGSLQPLVGWGAAPNRLYQNDGRGLFADVSANYLLQNPDRGAHVVLADLDGDQDLDAFLANNDACRVLLSAAPGYLVEWANLPPHPTYATGAVHGDIDGDGDLDVIVSYDPCPPNAAPYVLFRNGGSLRFDVEPLPVMLRPGNRRAPPMALFDLEGDGDLDLYLGEGDGHRLLRNDGRGGLTTALLAIQPPLQQAAAALLPTDFDGDGDTDLLISHDLEGYSTLLFNDGRGTLRNAAQSSFGTNGSLSTDLALGDLDGDGFCDAVTSSACVPQMLYFHRNDGTGDLETAGFFATLPNGVSVSDLALADIDGDGDLDLYVALSSAGIPFDRGGKLFRNDGSGNFVDVTEAQLLIGAFPSTSAAFGDLDGDGDQDLVVAANPESNLTGGHERLLWNDGTGRFTDGSSAFPYENLYSSNLALVDFDRDGDLDVFVAQSAALSGSTFVRALDSVYVNLGQGRFQRSPYVLPPIAETTTSIAFGDIDRDGDLDLLVGTFRQGTWLHRNEGASYTRLPLGTLPGPNYPDPTRQVELVDLDGDGWLDIVIANEDASFRSYRCTSSIPGTNPTYVEVTPLGWPFFFNCMPNATGLGFADLDRDGDLDAVTTAHDRVLTNVARQIARRGPARVGRPLDIDVYGSSGAPWMLFAAASRMELEVAPLGVLRAGPLGLHVCGSGACDAAGLATASFRAPRDPSLVGRTIYWQALIGAPPVFSNLEKTRFER